MVSSVSVRYKKDKFACLFDADTYVVLSQWVWQYRCGYAGRRRNKTEPEGGNWVHAHREVLRLNGINVPQGYVVDHINGNRMDNRLENLRVVTKSINGKNVETSVIKSR